MCTFAFLSHGESPLVHTYYFIAKLPVCFPKILRMGNHDTSRKRSSWRRRKKVAALVSPVRLPETVKAVYDAGTDYEHRVSDEGVAAGVAVRTGGATRLWGSGAREPRRFFPPPMLQRLAWSLAAAKLLHLCFCHRCGVRSTQEMILGSTKPQYACSAQLCCPRCR